MCASCVCVVRWAPVRSGPSVGSPVRTRHDRRDVRTCVRAAGADGHASYPIERTVRLYRTGMRTYVLYVQYTIMIRYRSGTHAAHS